MQVLSPIEWALRPLKKYAVFSGRAARAEYWWYVLAAGLVGFLLKYIDGKIGARALGIYGPLTLVCWAALLIPGLAVVVRRLHDIGRTGWWVILRLGSYGFMAAGFTMADPDQLWSRLIQTMGLGVAAALFLGWLVSSVVLFIFMITQGEEGANLYGSDPYGPDTLEEVFA